MTNPHAKSHVRMGYYAAYVKEICPKSGSDAKVEAVLIVAKSRQPSLSDFIGEEKR
jgi:hypothetical protein